MRWVGPKTASLQLLPCVPRAAGGCMSAELGGAYFLSSLCCMLVVYRANLPFPHVFPLFSTATRKCVCVCVRGADVQVEALRSGPAEPSYPGPQRRLAEAARGAEDALPRHLSLVQQVLPSDRDDYQFGFVGLFFFLANVIDILLVPISSPA